MNTSRTRVTRVTRLSMMGFALICLLGQLWTVVHLSVVQHITCEHGELIEVSPGAGAQASDAVLTAQAGVEAADCHDHCLLGASRREGPRVVRATALVTRLVLALPRFTGITAPPPSIPLLLAAPKSSPPV